MSGAVEFVVPCATCDGLGKVPMPKHLRETFDIARAIERSGGEVTTEAIRHRLGSEAPRPTAMCQRVARLVALGLLRRVGRSGRGFKSQTYALVRSPHETSVVETRLPGEVR